MLDTIKKLIDNSPYISFEQYYQNYIMQVQDSSIDAEVTFLLRNNFPSANSMIKLINKEVDDFGK